MTYDVHVNYDLRCDQTAGAWRCPNAFTGEASDTDASTAQAALDAGWYLGQDRELCPSHAHLALDCEVTFIHPAGVVTADDLPAPDVYLSAPLPDALVTDLAAAAPVEYDAQILVPVPEPAGLAAQRWDSWFTRHVLSRVQAQGQHAARRGA